MNCMIYELYDLSHEEVLTLPRTKLLHRLTEEMLSLSYVLF